MGQPLDRPAQRRQLIRIGVICLCLGALRVAGVAAGWIRAGGDPGFHFQTKRGNMPLWVMTLWIGAFGALLTWLGAKTLRDAAAFRADHASGNKLGRE
ncbi:MAG: hypothetical protein ACTII7_12710 [Galactobacter sp.]